jgi:hypothetical protein
VGLFDNLFKGLRSVLACKNKIRHGVCRSLRLLDDGGCQLFIVAYGHTGALEYLRLKIENL